MARKIRALVVMKSGAQFRLKLDTLTVNCQGNKITSIEWASKARDAHLTFIDADQIDAIVSEVR